MTTSPLSPLPPGEGDDSRIRDASWRVTSPSPEGGGDRGEVPRGVRGEVGPGGEFDRIRRIWSRLGDRVQGAGDDCVIVDIGGIQLAFSTDLSLEHVHFELGWLTREEIGWRATAAALSDLAAVAAAPMGILVSLGVSEEWPEEQIADLMEGAGKAAAAVGAVVWGGDLTRNVQTVVGVTVVGRLDAPPLLRSGARAGDELWVTGTLGGPGAALASWKNKVQPDESARERFALPMPRVNEARWLRDHGATAMIDLSDGLAADATHIAAASGVRCVIREELVPVHPSAESEEAAVVSGEEYELLSVLPAGSSHLGAAFVKQFNFPLTRVGTVEPGEGVIVTRGGQPVELKQTFRHF